MSKILLTGGTGFFGSYIKEALEKENYTVYTFSSSKYNMLDYEAVRAAFIDSRPEYVIHAAGVQGGIGYNLEFPAKILVDNIRMSSNLFDACVEFKPKKVLSIISSCAYPNLDGEIEETQLHSGRAHDTIAFHAFAKRFLQEASLAYNKQFGLNAVTVAVTNLFGERANFHPNHSKVVEATIRKLTSNQDVEFWGRGIEKRQLMYAKDAAYYVVKALELYNDNTKPLNIGSDNEISIKDLVDKVKKLTKHKNKISWDTSKPDGQLRKKLNIDTLKTLLTNNNMTFQETDFEEALRATIDWYSNSSR